MFYVFILDMFNHALVFCVLLFAFTSHLILYTALPNEYLSTAVLTTCIYSFVM